jgi:hypothetical protein
MPLLANVPIRCREVRSVLQRFLIAAGRKVSLFLVLSIFAAIGAEGLRYVCDAFSRKLSTLPMLAVLDDYEETAGVDLAILIALFIGFSVCTLWFKNVRVFLHPSEPLDGSSMDAPERHAQLVRVLGFSMLGTDAVLFFVGMLAMSDGGWATDGLGAFGAVLVTVLYTSMLVFIAYYFTLLERKLS